MENCIKALSDESEWRRIEGLSDFIDSHEALYSNMLIVVFTLRSFSPLNVNHVQFSRFKHNNNEKEKVSHRMHAIRNQITSVVEASSVVQSLSLV